MATLNELQASIAKMQKVVDKPTTSASIKNSLKKGIEKAQAQVKELEKAAKLASKPATPARTSQIVQIKKTAAVVSKQIKAKAAASSTSAMFALAKAKRTGQGLSTAKGDIEKDARRPALPKGYRISKNGNKYWEGRDNRIDRKPNKKYPKLEKGGELKKK